MLAALGTLTAATLALDSGSQLDFGITDTVTLDKIVVSTNGGLTITGGQVNINGGVSAFTANGTYPLISHTGAAIAGINSLLTVNGLNKSVTKTYTFTDVGGFVNLVVANSGVAQTFWNVNADGNWNTGGNWTPTTPPNAAGAFAGFGGGGTAITAPRTVTVDGAFTVGTLSFNNATQPFTLAAGGGANLTLNNSASGAFVTDAAGSHTVKSSLTLTSNGATFTVTNLADTLTVGGVITGSGTPLIKGGPGTLALYGANNYTSGTTLNASTLLINSETSLGDSTNTTEIFAATLRATTNITTTRNISIGDFTSTISVAAGMTYQIDGFLLDAASAGTLNKAGNGTLVLNGANTYTGGTVINTGIVAINNAASLGNAGGAVTINAATLETTANIATTRNINLGNAASTIQTDPATIYTVTGTIGSTGTLIKTGTGTLTIGTASAYSGGTLIKAGTISVGNGGTVAVLGTGTVTFEGGSLTNSYNANNTWGFNRAVVVASGQTGTLNMGNRMSFAGNVSGAGTLNINLNTSVTRDDLNNSWTGFTGQVNFAGTGAARLLNNGGTFDTNSFANCSVDVRGSAFLQTVTNSGGNTYPIGTLSGSSATAGFSGGTAGTATLSVGALNVPTTTFAGQINGNSALTKVGAGTLILSGANTYTGTTTVNGGTLSLSTAYLADAAAVVIGASGVINLTHGATDQVGSLTINGVLKPNGVYDSTTDPGFITGTGKLQVGVAGYSGWATTNAGGQASNLDFDLDGVSNGVEYFMGATGSTFTANPGIVSGKVTWPKDPAYSGTYTVQTSPDLVAWTNVASTVVGNTVEYTLPTGQGKLFVRLNVTPN